MVSIAYIAIRFAISPAHKVHKHNYSAPQIRRAVYVQDAAGGVQHAVGREPDHGFGDFLRRGHAVERALPSLTTDFL